MESPAEKKHPKLVVKFTVQEIDGDLERYITFGDTVTIGEVQDFFVRSGIAVGQLFQSHAQPRGVYLDSFPSNLKIQTIKLIREFTGAGLKDAKDICEGCFPNHTGGFMFLCDNGEDAFKCVEEFKNMGIVTHVGPACLNIPNVYKYCKPYR